MGTGKGIAFILGFIVMVGAAWEGAAQEKITLTVPVFQDSGTSNFRVEAIYLKRTHPDAPAEIRATLRETGTADATFVPNGRVFVCAYDGDTADAIIRALNTANLSTMSLEKRVIQRCQADGKLGAGTITGSPQ